MSEMTNRQDERSYLTTLSLVVLATLAIAWTLHHTASVMIPFVISIFIVSMVSPLVDSLVLEHRLPKVLAVSAAVAVVCLVVGAMVMMAIGSVSKIVEEAPNYSNHVTELLSWLTLEGESGADGVAEVEVSGVAAPPAEGATVPAVTLDQIVEGESGGVNDEAPTAADPSTVVDDGPPAETQSKQFDFEIYLRGVWREMLNAINHAVPRVVAGTVGTAFDLMSRAFLVVIFVLFLLAGRKPHKPQARIYDEIDSQIRSYISRKFLLSAATGSLVWVTLKAIGLPLAPVFGMLAFLFNFIPSIGSVIATLLPIPLAFVLWYHPLEENAEPEPVPAVTEQADSDSGNNTQPTPVASSQEDDQSREDHQPWKILFVILVPGIIQNVIGNAIEPKIMGDELKLNPIMILLALSFWGFIWGPVGMLLATPITAVIRIILLRFETGRPLADLMAGKLPTLEPRGETETA